MPIDSPSLSSHTEFPLLCRAGALQILAVAFGCDGDRIWLSRATVALYPVSRC